MKTKSEEEAGVKAGSSLHGGEEPAPSSATPTRCAGMCCVGTIGLQLLTIGVGSIHGDAVVGLWTGHKRTTNVSGGHTNSCSSWRWEAGPCGLRPGQPSLQQHSPSPRPRGRGGTGSASAPPTPASYSPSFYPPKCGRARRRRKWLQGEKPQSLSHAQTGGSNNICLHLS